MTQNMLPPAPTEDDRPQEQPAATSGSTPGVEKLSESEVGRVGFNIRNGNTVQLCDDPLDEHEPLVVRALCYYDQERDMILQKDAAPQVIDFDTYTEQWVRYISPQELQWQQTLEKIPDPLFYTFAFIKRTINRIQLYIYSCLIFPGELLDLFCGTALLALDDKIEVTYANHKFYAGRGRGHGTLLSSYIAGIKFWFHYFKVRRFSVLRGYILRYMNTTWIYPVALTSFVGLLFAGKLEYLMRYFQGTPLKHLEKRVGIVPLAEPDQYALVNTQLSDLPFAQVVHPVYQLNLLHPLYHFTPVKKGEDDEDGVNPLENAPIITQATSSKPLSAEGFTDLAQDEEVGEMRDPLREFFANPDNDTRKRIKVDEHGNYFLEPLEPAAEPALLAGAKNEGTVDTKQGVQKAKPRKLPMLRDQFTPDTETTRDLLYPGDLWDLNVSTTPATLYQADLYDRSAALGTLPAVSWTGATTHFDLSSDDGDDDDEEEGTKAEAAKKPAPVKKQKKPDIEDEPEEWVPQTASGYRLTPGTFEASSGDESSFEDEVVALLANGDIHDNGELELNDTPESLLLGQTLKDLLPREFLHELPFFGTAKLPGHAFPRFMLLQPTVKAEINEALEFDEELEELQLENEYPGETPLGEERELYDDTWLLEDEDEELRLEEEAEEGEEEEDEDGQDEGQEVSDTGEDDDDVDDNDMDDNDMDDNGVDEDDGDDDEEDDEEDDDEEDDEEDDDEEDEDENEDEDDEDETPEEEETGEKLEADPSQLKDGEETQETPESHFFTMEYEDEDDVPLWGWGSLLPDADADAGADADEYEDLDGDDDWNEGGDLDEDDDWDGDLGEEDDEDDDGYDEEDDADNSNEYDDVDDESEYEDGEEFDEETDSGYEDAEIGEPNEEGTEEENDDFLFPPEDYEEAEGYAHTLDEPPLLSYLQTPPKPAFSGVFEQANLRMTPTGYLGGSHARIGDTQEWGEFPYYTAKTLTGNLQPYHQSESPSFGEPFNTAFAFALADRHTKFIYPWVIQLDKIDDETMELFSDEVFEMPLPVPSDALNVEKPSYLEQDTPCTDSGGGEDFTPLLENDFDWEDPGESLDAGPHARWDWESDEGEEAEHNDFAEYSPNSETEANTNIMNFASTAPLIDHIGDDWANGETFSIDFERHRTLDMNEALTIKKLLVPEVAFPLLCTVFWVWNYHFRTYGLQVRRKLSPAVYQRTDHLGRLFEGGSFWELPHPLGNVPAIRRILNGFEAKRGEISYYPSVVVSMWETVINPALPPRVERWLNQELMKRQQKTLGMVQGRALSAAQESPVIRTQHLVPKVVGFKPIETGVPRLKLELRLSDFISDNLDQRSGTDKTQEVQALTNKWGVDRALRFGPPITQRVMEEISHFTYLSAIVPGSDRLESLPKGILLMGEDGNGQELFGRALASHARVPFFITESNRFIDEKRGLMRLISLFRRTRVDAPTVVYIRDLDFITRHREWDVRWQSIRLTTQFLICMDGYIVGSETRPTQRAIFVLGAVKNDRGMDPACLRSGRLEWSLKFQYPLLSERTYLLQVLTWKSPLKMLAPLNWRYFSLVTRGYTVHEMKLLLNASFLHARLNGQHGHTNKTLNSAVAHYNTFRETLPRIHRGGDHGFFANLRRGQYRNPPTHWQNTVNQTGVLKKQTTPLASFLFRIFKWSKTPKELEQVWQMPVVAHGIWQTKAPPPRLSPEQTIRQGVIALACEQFYLLDLSAFAARPDVVYDSHVRGLVTSVTQLYRAGAAVRVVEQVTGRGKFMTSFAMWNTHHWVGGLGENLVHNPLRLRKSRKHLQKAWYEARACRYTGRYTPPPSRPHTLAHMRGSNETTRVPIQTHQVFERIHYRMVEVNNDLTTYHPYNIYTCIRGIYGSRGWMVRTYKESRIVGPILYWGPQKVVSRAKQGEQMN